MRRGLAADTVAYGAAMLAERGLGFLLLPLLTRHLSPAEYGIWTQTFVVSSMLMPLLSFCLPAAMVRFFAGGVDFPARRRWTIRALGWMALVALALGALAWRAAEPLSQWIYGSAAARDFVPVLVVLVVADTLVDMTIGFLRSAFRMRWVSLLVLARGLLRFGVMLVGLVVLQAGFRASFLAFAVSQGALAATMLLAAFLPPAGAAVDEAPAGRIEWRPMLVFAAPLVLISVWTSVNAYTDRFVLTHLLGLDSVAVYSATSSLVSLASVAYTVLGFTLFPVLARHWAQGERAAAVVLSEQAVRVFLFLALPFVLGVAAVIDVALPLLATAHYRGQPLVALLLGLGVVGFGLYQIMLYLMLLAGRGLRAAWLVIAAALLNAALNAALVPLWGMAGAAAAAFASNALLAAGAYRAAGLRFPWRGASRIAALGAGAAFVAWLVTRAAGGWPGLAGAALAAALVVVASDLFGRASVVKTLLGASTEPLR